LRVQYFIFYEMMKKNILISVCTAALVLCTACKDESVPVTPEPYVPVDPTEIALKATIALADDRKENSLLMRDLQWNETDSIGLFMERNENLYSEGYALYPGSLSEDRRGALFTGALHWEKSAIQHNFYAYYPKAVGATDASQIPVTLPANQTQKGGSADHLKLHNLLVASPSFVTAPGDITDTEQNKSINMDFISAFSIIEFRFASYKENNLKINKVTLSSNRDNFAVTDGMLDLKAAPFSSGFAHITGGKRDTAVQLTIIDPLPVPVSEKITIIPNNDGSKPADPEIVFPASLLALPNINAPANTEGEEAKWTVSLETNLGHFERTFTPRNMKPGEKYSIEYVVITSDTTGIDDGPIVDDTPGTPWDGTVTAPPASQIDLETKVVTIRQPGELAWLAQIVNCERSLELVTDTFFKEYTVVLEKNIHLGDREWAPIGKTFNSEKRYAFRGTFDGQGHMITNFKITSSNNANYVFAGLFGCSGAEAIRNLRVQDATISLPVLTNAALAYVGGIVAYWPSEYAVNISNCSFDGTIDVNYSTHTWPVGGIVGYALGSGTISGCKSSARITGTSSITNSARADIGGIVGYASGIRIKDCLFTGSLKGIGHWNAGGIAGNPVNGSIVASKNTGTVDCNGGQAVIGGIAGYGGCDIISCYNTGDIDASGGTGVYDSKGVGGIAGSLLMGGLGLSGKTLKGCYSTGTVKFTLPLRLRTGNIVGWYEPLSASIPFNFNGISNNYFSGKPLSADTPDNLGANRITRFAAAAWPSTGMDGWGVGDGSGDNKYWNVDFPAGYGTNYPYLYWENVQ
jgi:hypothetical protein